MPAPAASPGPAGGIDHHHPARTIIAIHLFVQKFSGGEPAPLPYQAVLEVLQRHGTPGRGPVGDLEIIFPPDKVAHYGLLVGDAQQRAQCIALIRPVFDDHLRRLAFELMSVFGAALFDDALGCAYVMGDPQALPATLRQACVCGVQRITSPQQLWPAGLWQPAGAPDARPALLFPDPNPQGLKYVMLDRVEAAQQHLHMDFETRTAACNPGTLRALRNVLLKLDTALAANPEMHASFHFADPEANLLILESPKIAEARAGATMVVSGEVMLGMPVPEPLFVAEADWFFSNRQKAADLRAQTRTAHGIEIAPGSAGMAALDALLERMHQAVLKQRGTRAALEDAANEKLLHWADSAGACIGEAIRTDVGGQWGAVTILGQRHPVVHTHTGRHCWPKLVAFNRIMNGAGQSVAAYVDELVRTARSPTPRNADITAEIPQLCSILLGHAHFHKGGLPLQEKIAVAQLDFSLASLSSLDSYLAAVHTQRAGVAPQALANLALAAGAYLGEVVRRNARARWSWNNYDDFFSTRPANPDMPKSVNTCALLIGPGIAALPMQSCNVGAWGATPQGVQAQVREWLSVAAAGDDDDIRATVGTGSTGAGPAGAVVVDINVDVRARMAALTPEERAYVRLPPPPWIASDELRRLIDDHPKLLLEGRVVWGHLVQANNALFAPGAEDSPAEVVYDPSGRLAPEHLAPIARQLFKLKGTRLADADEARIAEHLTAEFTRAFAMPVPRGIAGDGLLLSTILVARKHLPNQRLSMGYFPILISDACPGSTMILPGRWWPHALAEEWGIEEPAPLPAKAAPVAAQPGAVEPPDLRAYKGELLHIVKAPVPRDEEAAWDYLDQLLAEEEAWRQGEAKGMLGKLLGRRQAPEPRTPDPLFAKYLAHMRKAYPGVCDMPEDLGGNLVSLLVAEGSVNYVVETARREFGLIVFAPGSINLVYRPAPK
jgi:hypothetical protein